MPNDRHSALQQELQNYKDKKSDDISNKTLQEELSDKQDEPKISDSNNSEKSILGGGGVKLPPPGIPFKIRKRQISPTKDWKTVWQKAQ